MVVRGTALIALGMFMGYLLSTIRAIYHRNFHNIRYWIPAYLTRLWWTKFSGVHLVGQ